MSIRTLDTLNAAFNARHPQAAQPGTVGSLQAAGAVRGFASVSGKLQWVRATEHFYATGEFIAVGDLVQVSEPDAKGLVRSGRAELATDAEVAEAQKPAGKAK